MQGYGWTKYDPRTGGSQTIRDAELHVDLATEFLKSDDGNSWSVRVSGSPRPDAPDNLNTTVIFHAAIEKTSLGSRSLDCGDEGQTVRRRQNVEAECHGEAPGLGSFQLSVTTDGQRILVHDTVVNSVEVDEDKIWQAKCMDLPLRTAVVGLGLTYWCTAAVFTDEIKATEGDFVAVEHRPGTGNMHFIQTTFSGAFSVTFTYGTLEDSLLGCKLTPPYEWNRQER